MLCREVEPASSGSGPPARPPRFEVWAGLTSAPHPDYPPLLPFTVTRLWRALGREFWWAPACLGATLAIGTAAILWCACRRLRGRPLAGVAVCTLLGATVFPYQAAGQIADVPSGFFNLCAVVAIAIALQAPAVCPWVPTSRVLAPAGDQARLRTWPRWVLAGMAAGAALLCKNEGALFAAALLAALAVFVPWRHGARALAGLAGMLLGAVPFLCALACHRALTPANELLPFHRFAEVARLALDGQRWREGVPAFLVAVAGFGKGLLALLVLLALARRRPATAPSRPQVTLALSVFAAFVLAMAVQLGLAIVSPYGTRYHIDTTQTRLVLQWWPCLVFAAMLLVDDPWLDPEVGGTANHAL
jgi:hypothetical protein